MGDNSKIEWTDATWNPVTGCKKISAGCKHCYAEEVAARMKRMGVKGYENGFEPTFHPDRLTIPIKWKKARRIFVCSMSDLFQDDVPLGYIGKVYDAMNQASQHTFQVLTKRPERMNFWMNAERYVQFDELIPSFDHVWHGTTIENLKSKDERLSVLRETQSRIRFLSCEPLLEDLGELDLRGIHWVIVGGESGPYARPMNPDWVRSIRDQCVKQGVSFFFKQWGEWAPIGEHNPFDYEVNRAFQVHRIGKAKAGRVLDGRTWEEFPGPIEAAL